MASLHESWHWRTDIPESVDISNEDNMLPLTEQRSIHNNESIDITDEDTMLLSPSSQQPSHNNGVIDTIDITGDVTMLPPSRESTHGNGVITSIDITNEETMMMYSPSQEPILNNDVIDITYETQKGTNLNLKQTPMLSPHRSPQRQAPSKSTTKGNSPSTSRSPAIPSADATATTSDVPSPSCLNVTPAIFLSEDISIVELTSEKPQTSKEGLTKKPVVKVVDCMQYPLYYQNNESEILKQNEIYESKVLAHHIINNVYKESAEDITNVNNAVKDNINNLPVSRKKKNKNASKTVSKSKTAVSKQKNGVGITNAPVKKIDLQNNTGLVGLIIRRPESDLKVTKPVNDDIDYERNNGMVGMTIQRMIAMNKSKTLKTKENIKMVNDKKTVLVDEKKIDKAQAKQAKRYLTCSKNPMPNVKKQIQKEQQEIKTNLNECRNNMQIDISQINLPILPNGTTITTVHTSTKDNDFAVKASTSHESKNANKKQSENSVHSSSTTDLLKPIIKRKKEMQNKDKVKKQNKNKVKNTSNVNNNKPPVNLLTPSSSIKSQNKQKKDYTYDQNFNLQQKQNYKGIDNEVHGSEFQIKKQSVTENKNLSLDSVIRYSNIPSSLSITKYNEADVDSSKPPSEMKSITNTCSITIKRITQKNPLEKTKCDLAIESCEENSKPEENKAIDSPKKVEVEKPEIGNNNAQQHNIMTGNPICTKVQTPSVSGDKSCNTSATIINSLSNKNQQVNNFMSKDTRTTDSGNAPSLLMTQNLQDMGHKTDQDISIDLTQSNVLSPQIPIRTQPSEMEINNTMIPVTAMINQLLTLKLKAAQKPLRSQYEKHKPKQIVKKKIIGKNIRKKTNSPNNKLRNNPPKNTHNMQSIIDLNDVYLQSLNLVNLMNTTNQTNVPNPSSSKTNPLNSPNCNAPLQKHNTTKPSSCEARQPNFQSASHHKAPLQQQHVSQSPNCVPKVPQQDSSNLPNYNHSLQLQNAFNMHNREAPLHRQHVFQSPSQVPIEQQHPISSPSREQQLQLQAFTSANHKAPLHQQGVFQPPSQELHLQQLQHPLNALSREQQLQLQAFTSANHKAPLHQQGVFQPPSQELHLEQLQHPLNVPSREQQLQQLQAFISANYKAPLHQQSVSQPPSQELHLQQLQHHLNAPSRKQQLQLQAFTSANHKAPLHQLGVFQPPSQEIHLQQLHHPLNTPGREQQQLQLQAFTSANHMAPLHQQDVYQLPIHELHLQELRHAFNSVKSKAEMQQQLLSRSPSHKAPLEQHYPLNSPSRKVQVQLQPLFQSPCLTTLLQQQPPNSPSHEATLQQKDASKSPKYQPLLHKEHAYKSPDHHIPYLQANGNKKSPNHEKVLRQERANKPVIHQTSSQQKLVDKSPKYQELLHQELAYKSPSHKTSEQELASKTANHNLHLPQEHASTSKQQAPLHLEHASNEDHLQHLLDIYLKEHLQQQQRNVNPAHAALLQPEQLYQDFLQCTLSPKTNLDQQIKHMNHRMTIGGATHRAPWHFPTIDQEASSSTQDSLGNDSQKPHVAAGMPTGNGFGNPNNAHNAFTSPKCPPSQPSVSSQSSNASRSSTAVGRKRALPPQTYLQQNNTESSKRQRSAE